MLNLEEVAIILVFLRILIGLRFIGMIENVKLEIKYSVGLFFKLLFLHGRKIYL